MTTQDPARADSPGVYVHPPIAFALCLLAGITVACALGAWNAGSMLVPASSRIAFGVLVAAAGFGLVAWGIGLFRRRGVDPSPNTPAAQLVTAGVYRLTRNPMYVGLVAILAGIGVAAGAWPILAGAVLLFVYLDRHVIAREEAYLTRTFGADYAAYCGRVRRWL